MIVKDYVQLPASTTQRSGATGGCLPLILGAHCHIAAPCMSHDMARCGGFQDDVLKGLITKIHNLKPWSDSDATFMLQSSIRISTVAMCVVSRM